MDLITLADLPALPDGVAKPKVKIAIGRLDKNLRDPRYGKFAITQSDVDSWKRNLAGVFGGQVSFDFDHSSDRGNGTRAAAWVSNIGQTGTAEGSLITADVQFTRRGAQAVRDGDYKYTSPTFVENYTDEHGEKHGKALIGGALTNRPVLRKGMPTLSLSRDVLEGVTVPQDLQETRDLLDATFALGVPASERKIAVKEGNALPDGSYPIRNTAQLHAAAILAASGHGDAAAAKKLIARRAKELGVSLGDLPGMGKAPTPDSRRQMDTAQLAKLLGLPEDSEDSVLLAKITELNAPAKPAEPAKPDPAKPTELDKPEPGATTITLSAEQAAKLMADANAGAAAAVTLAEERFERKWQEKLDAGCAAPSQHDTLLELHKADPDLAIKTLDSFVKIVPVKPSGSGESAAVQTPAGMDEERYQLHTQAKTLAAEKVKADPKLGADEAYILAVNEISERQFELEHPGI